MRARQNPTILLAIATLFALNASGQRGEVVKPLERTPTFETERTFGTEGPRGRERSDKLRETFGVPDPFWLFREPLGPIKPPIVSIPPTKSPPLGLSGIINRLSEYDRIYQAQTKLAERGYLNFMVDLDGKIGPRTRQALAEFQRNRNLKPTGALNGITERELGISPPIWQGFRGMHLLESPDSSGQYRFLDASGRVLFQGDDPKLLVAKLKESSLREPLYIEMKGFSEDKAEALATSLRIQARQIDPAASIVVLPQDGVTRENLLSRGIRLDQAPDPVEGVTPVLTFSVRSGEQVRSFGVRIVAASIDLYHDLCDAFRSLLPSAGFDENRSLDQLVRDARKKLQLKYPNLSGEQLRIELLHQFGSTQISRLRPEVSFAWS
jgi:peptidoglycan hydrolase-like protein with peptidoglycan-binding domain